MKLSVAMCTYNGARYVREQLDSIASQTRLPDQLVVCDDASTDETVEHLHEFAQRAPFTVQVIKNEKNLGSTRNFDHAIDFCEGDFIAFADQDDVWLPPKLEKLEERLINGSALAFTNGEIVDSSLHSMGASLWEAARFSDRDRKQFSSGGAFEVLMTHNVVTGAAMAFRAEFKRLIQPIPDGLVHQGVPVLHDWWAALLIAAVADLSFVDQRLFNYRQHEHQQLGVKPISNMTNSRLSLFKTQLSYVYALRERLETQTFFEVRPGVLEGLRDQIVHLESRIGMPRARARRLAPVARELFSRRYHRYSNGLYSAARDMLSRS